LFQVLLEELVPMERPVVVPDDSETERMILEVAVVVVVVVVTEAPEAPEAPGVVVHSRSFYGTTVWAVQLRIVFLTQVQGELAVLVAQVV
jgi:hypothetical protein